MQDMAACCRLGRFFVYAPQALQHCLDGEAVHAGAKLTRCMLQLKPDALQPAGGLISRQSLTSEGVPACRSFGEGSDSTMSGREARGPRSSCGSLPILAVRPLRATTLSIWPTQDARGGFSAVSHVCCMITAECKAQVCLSSAGLCFCTDAAGLHGQTT